MSEQPTPTTPAPPATPTPPAAPDDGNDDAQIEAPGTPAQQEDEAINEDQGAESEAGPGFDLEAFVAALPDGVCLCPSCMGMGAVVEDPPFDPHTHRCETCLGFGRVRTGSQVSDAAERPCVDCQGKGYRVDEAGTPPSSPARPTDVQGELAPRDYMGRTPDDPDFDWARVTHNVEPVVLDVPEPATV